MRKVWMEREKNSWDGLWHTEQCNLDYKCKKALINYLSLPQTICYQYSFFLQREEEQKDPLWELQTGKDLNTVTLEKSQSSGSFLGCSLLDGKLTGPHKSCGFGWEEEAVLLCSKTAAQQSFPAHTLGSLKSASQIHGIIQIKHELNYL